MKIRYKPRIEEDPASGQLRQVFEASRVEFGDEEGTRFVQLAEDLGETSVHSLLFVMPSAEDEHEECDLYVEFNDQGNGLMGPEVGRVELYRDRLVLTPAQGRRLGPGRVSYQKNVDPFEGPACLGGEAIAQVVALLDLGPERLVALADALAPITRYGAKLEVRL